MGTSKSSVILALLFSLYMVQEVSYAAQFEFCPDSDPSSMEVINIEPKYSACGGEQGSSCPIFGEAQNVALVFSIMKGDAIHHVSEATHMFDFYGYDNLTVDSPIRSIKTGLVISGKMLEDDSTPVITEAYVPSLEHIKSNARGKWRVIFKSYSNAEESDERMFCIMIDVKNGDDSTEDNAQ